MGNNTSSSSTVSHRKDHDEDDKHHDCYRRTPRTPEETIESYVKDPAVKQKVFQNQDKTDRLTETYMSKSIIDKLSSNIIRPTRASYSLKALGPSAFSVRGRDFVRKDFNLVGNLGSTICCSFWTPELTRSSVVLPCLIYLHGNGGSRVDATPYVHDVLRAGMSLFAFDFTGSGLSSGEYVSLGYFETEDLATVMNHVHSRENVGQIGLWGRSMGAATALMYAFVDFRIKAIVSDSAFSDFDLLSQEIIRRNAKSIPDYVVSSVKRRVEERVYRIAGLDTSKLVPSAYLKRCDLGIPILFIHGRADSFVDPTHCKRLYEVYAGPKNMLLVSGDHDDPRSNHTVARIINFFGKHLASSVKDRDAFRERTMTSPKYDEWVSVADLGPNVKEAILKTRRILTKQANKGHNAKSKRRRESLRNFVRGKDIILRALRSRALTDT